MIPAAHDMRPASIIRAMFMQRISPLDLPPKGTSMPRPMQERDLAFKCLLLAVDSAVTAFPEGNDGPGRVVKRAEAYLAFVLGTSDKTARERINAELDAAGVE